MPSASVTSNCFARDHVLVREDEPVRAHDDPDPAPELGIENGEKPDVPATAIVTTDGLAARATRSTAPVPATLVSVAGGGSAATAEGAGVAVLVAGIATSATAIVSPDARIAERMADGTMTRSRPGWRAVAGPAAGSTVAGSAGSASQPRAAGLTTGARSGPSAGVASALGLGDGRRRLGRHVRPGVGPGSPGLVKVGSDRGAPAWAICCRAALGARGHVYPMRLNGA